MAWNRKDRNEFCALMNNIKGRRREYWTANVIIDQMDIVRRFPNDITSEAQAFTDTQAEQWLNTHIEGMKSWLKAAKNLKKSIQI